MHLKPLRLLLIIPVFLAETILPASASAAILPPISRTPAPSSTPVATASPPPSPNPSDSPSPSPSPSSSPSPAPTITPSPQPEPSTRVPAVPTIADAPTDVYASVTPEPSPEAGSILGDSTNFVQPFVTPIPTKPAVLSGSGLAKLLVYGTSTFSAATTRLLYGLAALLALIGIILIGTFAVRRQRPNSLVPAPLVKGQDHA